MDFTTVSLGQFSVIGITVRTTNQEGRAQKDIGDLWQNFFQNDVQNQIPDKISNDIYCIYTDYESDASGAYTTILGCKVSSLENIPDGLIGKTIPETNYRLYKFRGKLPETVLNTWYHVWQTPMNRRYVADFDVYGSTSSDTDNAEVETYVSVQ